MTKRNVGDQLIEGLEEAIQHARGKKTKAIVHKIWVPDHINALNIRKNMGPASNNGQSDSTNS